MRKSLFFTLIELLVVIAIIGILMTLLVPSLSNARIAGKTAVSISNLKQIYTGSVMYADSYSGFLFLSSENPHSANDEVNWARMLYEHVKGEKFANNNASIDEMKEDQGYMGMMFCPVIRQDRGSCTQHGQGRSDYSMNRHFAPENRNISQLIEGKKEPFFSPGTAMPSTQAAPTLRNGSYNPNSIGYPAFEYLRQRTLGLYIDGHISFYTITEGSTIDSLINDRNDFQ